MNMREHMYYFKTVYYQNICAVNENDLKKIG